VAQPTLGRIAGDLFATGLLVHDAADSQRPDAQVLRAQVLQLLDAFVKHPAAQAAPQDEVDAARFALVAWLDETLGKSDWSGRTQWEASLLQLEQYNTNRAGNEFFQRLAALRPDQNAAREVYFLCLALGFGGQYTGHEAERLAIMQQQYELLRAAHRARDVTSLTPLAPPAYELEIDIEPPSRRGLLTIVLGWSLVAALVFGALWGLLYWQAMQVPIPEGM